MKSIVLRRGPVWSAIALVACVFASQGVDMGAQQASTARAPEWPGGLRVLPVRGNVFMIAGAGGNITMSIGKDGVVLVDTGNAAMSDAVLQTIRELDRRVTAVGMPARDCVGVVQGCSWWSSANFLATTVSPPAPRPIAGIVNTSGDPDHIGGNEKISSAGRTFGVRNIDRSALGAWIVAHENVTSRLSPNGNPTVAAGALPSEVYFGDEKKLNFINGEGVVVTHVANAHSDGDSIVHFRGSDVIAAGDFFNMDSYPVIDTQHGGTIQGVVDGMNKLLDLTVVEHMMEGGTMVVPGHGRLSDTADLAYYRDMATIMRDRVRELRKRGMTLEQIQRAGIGKDYDPRFGRSKTWTPAMFIEAIFKTLPPGT
jgi:glyoxylase-like metal-dependent hydrolase (beta-lactamase superfamily II)